ncbi:MAG: ABC transporter ATP-binding protein [Candidatus Hydrogenedentes bacterium]|nr:ABC transporter ATP-binding protein [Candidatus Hydrogenedentota bacterium]
MSNSNAIELHDVDKTFYTRHIFQKHEDTGRRRLYEKRAVHAVDRVNFTIERGEVFGLLGPNGAGKTTTVKMISGLVRPDAGKVFVDGLEVERKRLKVLRKIGVVLEGTRTCIWPLTPLENLSYFGNLRDVKGPILKQRARELLDFIGLKDKMNVQVRRLSRGQKQKLAVCIALITDPPVILLDEPTTGLDVQSSRAIRDKVIELTHERGKCALVTTHDMAVAQSLCDRIGIINHGALVACKPTDELLDVFSEQTFEFRVDRLPALDGLAAVPGVVGAEPCPEDDGPAFLLHLVQDEATRSAAMYDAMDWLRGAGCLLRSITRRQQTLENVFLRLTSEPRPARPDGE